MLKTRDCVCETGDKLEAACRDLMRECDRLRAENESLKQPKSCGTCARERGSAKCNNCALYYYRKPCMWIPAKALHLRR